MAATKRTSLVRKPPEKPRESGVQCVTCATGKAEAARLAEAKRANEAAVRKMLAGMPRDQRALVEKSPFLKLSLSILAALGWKVDYGSSEGGYCNSDGKVIHLGPGYRSAYALAHESGHALYGYAKPPHPDPTKMFKTAYVEASVDWNLRDEGEAQMALHKVRAEILAAKGPDITAGGGALALNSAYVYNQYIARKTTWDQTAESLGQLYGYETTSTTHQNYRVYYAQGQPEVWDASATPDRKKGNALRDSLVKWWDDLSSDWDF